MGICDKIAILLNQVEAGAPWPKSAPHAIVVYLEKEGAELGLVMKPAGKSPTTPRPATAAVRLHRGSQYSQRSAFLRCGVSPALLVLVFVFGGGAKSGLITLHPSEIRL